MPANNFGSNPKSFGSRPAKVLGSNPAINFGSRPKEAASLGSIPIINLGSSPGNIEGEADVDTLDWRLENVVETDACDFEDVFIGDILDGEAPLCLESDGELLDDDLEGSRRLATILGSRPKLWRDLASRP
jgi:hypothetical protein